MNIKSILTNKNRLYGILICVSVFLVACLVLRFLPFSYLENRTYDSRMAFAGNYSKPSDEIIFIELDQDSIDWAKEVLGWSWPWPRSAYADLVDFMRIGGAKAIAFDVLYTEPSVYGDSDDKAFARASAENGRVIQTVYITETESADEAVDELLPIPIIKDSAALLGNITSSKDPDDVIRRARLSYKTENHEYPALSVATLCIDEDPADVLEELKRTLPIQKDETVYLRYQKSIENYYPYRASEVLESYYDYKNGKEPYYLPEDFEDAYVFFAYYAPGLFDICSVPNYQVYPGVGVHITLLDNILNDSFITKLPFWVNSVSILILTILGFFCAFLAEKQKSQAKVVAFLIISPIIIVSIFVFFAVFLFVKGFWLAIVIPMIAFAASFLISLVLNYTTQGKQRRFIKAAFSQYVSPAVIDDLISDPTKLKLGGDRRELTMFFSDIQGFTSISEKLSPELLTDFLNAFLSEMSNIIMESGGTIDKYEGDAIIAFWNAPGFVEGHAKVAVLAALACQQRIAQMQEEFSKKAGSEIKMRIGLNTGNAVVGNFGSRERFDYTMLGDSVNLASRLEGLNKQFGTYTMCSESTKNSAEDSGIQIEWRNLATVAVVGKNEAVTVYEPLFGELSSERKQILQQFEEGRKLFYDGKFTEAIKIFEQIKEKDEPANRYLAKAQDFLENHGLWKGIWVATSK